MDFYLPSHSIYYQHFFNSTKYSSFHLHKTAIQQSSFWRDQILLVELVSSTLFSLSKVKLHDSMNLTNPILEIDAYLLQANPLDFCLRYHVLLDLCPLIYLLIVNQFVFSHFLSFEPVYSQVVIFSHLSLCYIQFGDQDGALQDTLSDL